jgi:hypothetical protein
MDDFKSRISLSATDRFASDSGMDGIVLTLSPLAKGNSQRVVLAVKPEYSVKQRISELQTILRDPGLNVRFLGRSAALSDCSLDLQLLRNSYGKTDKAGD